MSKKVSLLKPSNSYVQLTYKCILSKMTSIPTKYTLLHGLENILANPVYNQIYKFPIYVI